jgi:hypothetical protein
MFAPLTVRMIGIGAGANAALLGVIDGIPLARH